MKLLFYVSIIASLFLTSCEKEVEILENEVAYTQSLESSDSQKSQEANGIIKRDNTRGLAPPTESEIFMNKMEWASFVTAKIIHSSNDSYKSQIRGLVVNQKIPLEDLIGSDTQLQSFHDLFVGHLTDFLKSISCPEGQEEAPDKTMIDNPIKTTTQLIAEYLDYMLVQNCVELYFPVGILDRDKDVVSLSHPLSGDYGNYGYHRQEGCVSTYLTYIVPNHVFINKFNYTYVISRPVRRGMPGACHYTQYNPINFTQFLQGPF